MLSARVPRASSVSPEQPDMSNSLQQRMQHSSSLPEGAIRKRLCYTYSVHRAEQGDFIYATPLVRPVVSCRL